MPRCTALGHGPLLGPAFRTMRWRLTCLLSETFSPIGKSMTCRPSTKMRGTMNQANGTKNLPPNYNSCSPLTQVVSAPKLRTGQLLTFTAAGATPALWIC